MPDRSRLGLKAREYDLNLAALPELIKLRCHTHLDLANRRVCTDAQSAYVTFACRPQGWGDLRWKLILAG